MTLKLLGLALGGSLVCAVLATSGYWIGTESATFNDLNESYAVIAEHGFHCRSDRHDGRIASGYMVSRDPMTWADVNEVPKVGPMGAEWRGKVWVTSQMNMQCPQLAIPDKAKLHLWGSLYAFGDEDLISEIEQDVQPNQY
jgi:hypothetical protein